MWYYNYNGEQIGPVGDPEIKELIRAGTLGPATAVWTEGLPSWIELKGTRLSCFLVGTTIEKEAEALVAFGDTSWQPYAGIIFVFGLAGLSGAKDIDRGIPFSIASYLGSVSAVVAALFHYRCWMAIPPHLRALGPIKATGLLLIPVFNLYWTFVAFSSLSRTINCWRIAKGLEKDELHEMNWYPIWVTISIFYSSLVQAFIPQMRFFMLVASVTFFALFYRVIVGEIKSLQKT